MGQAEVPVGGDQVLGQLDDAAVARVVDLLLAVFDPPQILWIMYFGGAIVASAWMPVALASVLSKRVTKSISRAVILV